MKIKYILWIFVVIGMIGWQSCSDDSETLTPSDMEEWKPVLASGNNVYDEKIEDFYNRTGVYVLYQFEPREVYFDGSNAWKENLVDTIITSQTYTPNGDDIYVEGDYVYIQGTKYPIGTTDGEDFTTLKREVILTDDGDIYVRAYTVTLTKNSINVNEAKNEYVGKQFEWVEEMFLNFYPDTILRVALPLKIILGRNLWYTNSMYMYGLKEYSYYYSFHNLIFSHGDESLDDLLASGKNKIKNDVHSWFITERIESMYSLDEFNLVSDYSWAGGASSARPSTGQCYGLGFVIRPTTTILTTILKTDLANYLTLIMGNSYEKLTAEPANGNYNANDFTGILHPKKDINGLIRKKYDILMNEFRRLGIDLQAIGELYN